MDLLKKPITERLQRAADTTYKAIYMIPPPCQALVQKLYVFTYSPLLKKYIVTSKFLGVWYSDAFLLIPCLYGLKHCELRFVVLKAIVSCRLRFRSQKSFLKVLRNFFDKTQQSRKLHEPFTSIRKLKIFPNTETKQAINRGW